MTGGPGTRIRNDEAVADVLLAGAVTYDELASIAGISRETVPKVLRRLRVKYGLPVTTVDAFKDARVAGRPVSRYRILYPAGRVCSAEGCGTVLRRTNPSRRCECHGGGQLVLGVRG